MSSSLRSLPKSLASMYSVLKQTIIREMQLFLCVWIFNFSSSSLLLWEAEELQQQHMDRPIYMIVIILLIFVSLQYSNSICIRGFKKSSLLWGFGVLGFWVFV